MQPADRVPVGLYGTHRLPARALHARHADVARPDVQVLYAAGREVAAQQLVEDREALHELDLAHVKARGDIAARPLGRRGDELAVGESRAFAAGVLTHTGGTSGRADRAQTDRVLPGERPDLAESILHRGCEAQLAPHASLLFVQGPYLLARRSRVSPSDPQCAGSKCHSVEQEAVAGEALVESLRALLERRERH